MFYGCFYSASFLFFHPLANPPHPSPLSKVFACRKTTDTLQTTFRVERHQTATKYAITVRFRWNHTIWGIPALLQGLSSLLSFKKASYFSFLKSLRLNRIISKEYIEKSFKLITLLHVNFHFSMYFSIFLARWYFIQW